MDKHAFSHPLGSAYLFRVFLFLVLTIGLAAAVWYFLIAGLASQAWLPEAWFGPVFVSLAALAASLISILRVWHAASGQIRQRLSEQTPSAEISQLFGTELPGNQFWIWNWQDDSFVFASDWLSLFGFADNASLREYLRDRLDRLALPPEQRPLSCWELLIHPDDAAEMSEQMRQYLQNIHSEPFYSVRYRFGDSQGTYRWIQASGRALINAQGKVLGIASVFQDISAQIAVSEQLVQEKSFSEGLINSSDLFVLLLDTQGRILRFNPFAERVTGYEQAEVMGRSWIDCLFREADKPDMRRLFERVKINQAIHQKRANLLHKSGQEIELIWHYHALTNHQGKTFQLAVIGMDVTDRRILEKQLYELAFIDRLTGLPNQARLDQCLKSMISKRINREESLTLVYFDIDRFKHVNDALGYSAGDEMLKWVADQLRTVVGEPDVTGRLGEDEFVLLLSTHRTERSAGALVHQLQHLLQKPWQKDNHTFEITISTGIAFYPQHGSDFKTLLQHASIALFEAKDRGRNQICFYDQQMYLRNLRYIDQVSQLNQAIKQKEFVLYYQLQYDLKTGEARGAEALIRWIHPLRGLIPPKSFIPLAEAAGCINEISKWALEEASRQKRRWKEQGVAIEKVAVNLSSYSLKLPDLTNVVAKVLESSNLPGSEIELEITESALLDDIDGALLKIRELQKQGITFVLDDFGTGYSSMTYLRQLPVRVLKIDRAFVQTMLESTTDARIVKAIIDLAHDLELTVVAEGIETREQMRLLQSYDCDYGQGFLFHRPQPADQIILHELGHPTINAGNPISQRFL